MDKPVDSLGGRIRLAVEKSGKSRGEICRQIAVERAYLSRAIKGRFKPGADKLLALAGASGVSVDYLLGRSEEIGNIERRLRDTELDLLGHYRCLDKTTAQAVVHIIASAARSKATLQHVRSFAAIISPRPQSPHSRTKKGMASRRSDTSKAK